jgi:hypothetical protein
MSNKRGFWIFGSLQSATLGIILYIIFDLLNNMSDPRAIGVDTQIILSVLFPLYPLLVEYTIFSKIK